jgi:hypothetical protein
LTNPYSVFDFPSFSSHDHAQSQEDNQRSRLDELADVIKLQEALSSAWRGDDVGIDHLTMPMDEPYDDDLPDAPTESSSSASSSAWTTQLHVLFHYVHETRPHKQQLPKDEMTPIEVLQLFLTPSIINDIVEHSNASIHEVTKRTNASERLALI